MSYKYTLIVSQFYHSRHMFIVHHTADFVDKARELTKELTKHKRGDEFAHKELYLGDLDPKYYHDDRARYNVNDIGDIYFIQGDYANYLKDISNSYYADTLREGRGRQSVRVLDEISRHHDFDKVSELVKKYFWIA